MLDFVRIACAVPPVKVGDVAQNATRICADLKQANSQKVDILLFPELALTGCTCGDLFFQTTLLDGVKAGLRQIVTCSRSLPGVTAVVGLPLAIGSRLYNCAALIAAGEILGFVAKSQLSTKEKRWFTPGTQLNQDFVPASELGLTGAMDDVPVSCDHLFRLGKTIVGVEIGEALSTPIPASARMTTGGAQIILNPTATPMLVGQQAFRREAVRHQSGACHCLYASCSAGSAESTSDVVYSGHSMIAENGTLLAENADLIDTDYLLVQDCDLGRCHADRLRSDSFSAEWMDPPVIDCPRPAFRSDGSRYPLAKLPFIPSRKEDRIAQCLEIFQTQVTGLKQRLSTIHAKPVIGISGGLDSTLALLVAVEAVRQLGWPLTDVHGITMPCFGTSDRTYNNAWELMRKLGITCKEINIKESVSRHFQDIGHDSTIHNATYENAQARERTQILMDYAGMVGGISVGTGDLSELALGWCTYNGDHMSMYAVNGSIPKTLIRWIIEAVVEMPVFSPAKAVLEDILDTPISPELLPPDAQGKISQQTEDLVGPYALHDFFLFHVLRYGFTPTKIYALACRAFDGDFDRATIKKWLVNFYRRFFTQQFKRNCQPDGVRLGSVSLSPVSGWQMPSDAAAALWLSEAESLS